MQIIIFDDAEQVAEHAALWVSELITKKAKPVLGLATGSTPISLYKHLVNKHKNEGLSFSHVSSFNLDEYHNINANNAQSYRSFMKEHLFDNVDIAQINTYLPTCNHNQNPREQGLNYENKIKSLGGIDLQILGIGANGHIGFNEPTSSLSSRTRIKTLTQQTLTDNSRLFKDGETQPTMAMTMGIGTIMDARYVLLMATGENKAQAVNTMITGALSAMCPASALQMHENAVILLDKAAASQLQDHQYYLWADQQHRKINETYGFYHNY
ncbi:MULTISPECIES: glucosamine-6-phosphate deaminase [unclassified Colwellia]|jgi:glucosamine-6-phosphate deaminase|uniref:glucosamine-6-phosphate deaminase n=1 Tax=unclassified Colwellia TaxID=196834 RepID=UPI0015F4EF59|nr:MULTISPECIES: glucosamine-6-phosphate deaminase [unclassified Colwellia]MBA6336787.1 glucosamine-6-phosphate deaminase [Colwellia sp. BRX8-7]MBA6380081.1 glucosamine-6-phosphate deaminase [Colwellia sp. BRX10-7]MBA6387251.1 glucosamine-6-phosphate deaminase [Colwellia sp. BRX10-2]MBA6402312.1 glucosamine-6-phosphate deaminase [Colwellia sp. BRX10-5]MBA6406581.1 glucosamine-6-phosphate deaminase [Colwellia sp. BRX10-1]|tara:strand:- start:454 stop:1260 length:807 start_codon:yes stop_codon:yes gene_type:complete